MEHGVDTHDYACTREKTVARKTGKPPFLPMAKARGFTEDFDEALRRDVLPNLTLVRPGEARA